MDLDMDLDLDGPGPSLTLDLPMFVPVTYPRAHAAATSALVPGPTIPTKYCNMP